MTESFADVLARKKRHDDVLATLICALRQADEDGTYSLLSARARSLIGTALMSVDGPISELIAERDAAVAAYDLLYKAYTERVKK